MSRKKDFCKLQCLLICKSLHPNIYRKELISIKKIIRTPFFEVGTKNYIYGDAVIEMGKHLEKLSLRYDVDIFYNVPYTEIRAVAQTTERLIIFAPYMDVIRPGRGTGLVLPEAIKSAGAHGVLMNHCERPMTLATIRQTILRANELDLLSFACADTIEETKAVAQLHPDIINPEPTERIGSGNASDMSYVLDTIREIKSIDPNILVEQAAGITRGQQVFDFLMAGSEGAGAGSGIFTNPDPFGISEEMIQSVCHAREELKKRTKH